MKMTEYFDVLDTDGNQTGISRPRDEVHSNGLWHRSIYVWIINNNNEVFLQKRSANKKSYPNMWSISITGHLSSGENSINGAVREIEEELGVVVAPEDLKLIGTQKYTQIINSEFINNEFSDIFLLNLSLDVANLKLQEEEVSEVKYIHIDQLKEMVATKDVTLIMNDNAYNTLFNHLSYI